MGNYRHRVDEAAAGHAKLVEVIFIQITLTVTDDGRGIPIDKKDGDITALEVVFTELHAGGKFKTGAMERLEAYWSALQWSTLAPR